MNTWNVKKKWKGHGIQLIRLNLTNVTVIHKINYLLFKQMSMSTHNNIQTSIPQQNESMIIY